MKTMKAIIPLALLAALALIAYPLYADCGKCAADGKKIAAQLDQSKTTLAKAVTAAEQHSKGRAISVISDLNDKHQLGVHVFCIAGDKIMMCHFDPATGTVTGMKEVKAFPITEADHAGSHDHGKGSSSAPAGAGKMLTNQTAEVGCGMCMYSMPGVDSCLLAVMIDGKPYLVEGATWPNHDFCDAKLQAVVTGKLEGDKFIATSVKEKK